MIKVAIIDDELRAQNLLENMLNSYFPNKFHVVAKCASVDEGVTAINTFGAELIFLDIQMPGKNGFELFKQFDRINFEVIFTTAHDRFAVEAIRRSALDYILKPINRIDLGDAIKRFEERKRRLSTKDKLTLLLENLNVNDQNVAKLAFTTLDGYELIHSNQILYCKAESNYCAIKGIDGSITMATKTLKFVEGILPSAFLRIHKSFVINLNFVVRYHKANKEVELTNGEKLPVSFRKEEDFIHAILQHQ